MNTRNATTTNARRSELIRRIEVTEQTIKETYTSKKTIRRRLERLAEIRSTVPSPVYSSTEFVSKAQDEVAASIEAYRTQYASMLKRLAEDITGSAMLSTLSWKTDELFAIASKLSILEALDARIEGLTTAEAVYVAFTSFIADISLEVISQASRSGASRSTSTFSNAAEDIANQAKADFIRSPYWEAPTLGQLRHLLDNDRFATPETLDSVDASLDIVTDAFEEFVATLSVVPTF